MSEKENWELRFLGRSNTLVLVTETGLSALKKTFTAESKQLKGI